jgi:hypothetical protein
MDPRARVVYLLEVLGDTEEQVAESLRRLGVTGQRGEVCGCPIFNYLKDAGIPIAAVRDHAVYLLDGTRIELPTAVDEFIWFFDGYPEAWSFLVEPEEVNR